MRSPSSLRPSCKSPYLTSVEVTLNDLASLGASQLEWPEEDESVHSVSSQQRRKLTPFSSSEHLVSVCVRLL